MEFTSKKKIAEITQDLESKGGRYKIFGTTKDSSDLESYWIVEDSHLQTTDHVLESLADWGRYVVSA